VRPDQEPHIWVPMFKGTQSQCRRFADKLKEGGVGTRVTKGMGFYQVYAKQYKQPKFRERW
jgi:hypothetical protein